MVPALRRWTLWAGACLVALVLLIPRAASAQTCPGLTLSLGPTVPRFLPGGDTAANMVTPRPQNLDPNAVNYSDCNLDLNLQFTLLSNTSSCPDTIQVWVGDTDCTQLMARETTSGSARCWPATPPGLFQMASSSTENIRARDLVAFVSDSTESAPTAYSAHGLAACQSQDAPGVVPLQVTFIAFEADLATVDASVVYTMNAALVGPFPPTGVTAGVGENLIVVTWTPAVDSTIQGYNIYCEDQGGNGGDAALADGMAPEATLVCPDTGAAAVTDGAAEASATNTAACVPANVSGSSGAGGASCVSTNLVDSFCLVNEVSVPVESCLSTTAAEVDAGEAGVSTAVEIDAETEDASVPVGTAVGISNISSVYLCGQVGGNNTNADVVQGFTNGGVSIQDYTQYAVGVAAFDGEGNTGLISNLSCVIPAPVVTFWDQYIKDGGLAGGGFCALEAPGVPVGTSLFGIGMGAAAIACVRRRRRRR